MNDLILFSIIVILVPEAVTKFEVTERGSNHFVVTWNPPEEPNGILTGYVIEFEEGMLDDVKSVCYKVHILRKWFNMYTNCISLKG